MALYSIGEVAEKCGINPVTLRAWQRRYGLLKPQRSVGGHRQFDDTDIQRIEAIKRWIESGVSVSKVKALLDDNPQAAADPWAAVQEEILAVLREVRPAKLRHLVAALGTKHRANVLIDNIIVPVRLRLNRDHNTARTMLSLLDGALIDYAVSCISAARSSAGKEALLLAWNNEDRTRLWLEAWRLTQQGWRIDVLAEPLDAPHPEFFPGQHLFAWTGKSLTRSQSQQLTHWREQGFAIAIHDAP
ncbi:MerR family transcriptional regulator [Kosakonia sp.]|uniref:MerR family transcriptional regulator n=1 Tax=Kosakonia sp. TaxID=1916651 RepID=UPI0028A25341|nr:MerR family transcriptional regulator [Kosakonia sp.]